MLKPTVNMVQKSLRFPQDIVDAIADRADQERRSFNQTVVLILEGIFPKVAIPTEGLNK